jgi:hypothetical protein
LSLGGSVPDRRSSVQQHKRPSLPTSSNGFWKAAWPEFAVSDKRAEIST